jgi:enterochelin esterase-like enzyme
MVRIPKFGLPALILLVLITACSARDTTPVSEPATVDPASPTDHQVQPSQTPQLTQEPDTPATRQPTEDTLEQSCLERVGKVHRYEIQWGDDVLTGSIYTPPCYLESGLSYPALYLLHGATETDQQWEDLGLVEVTDDLIGRGDIPPLIIIMPREDTWVSLKENPFGDLLIQAVIPWVDNEYRTLPERRYRAVGGLSRGGNWALRLGLLHWGMFESLGAHSAPLFYGDLNRLPGWLVDIPDGSIPRIYLDISEGDKYLPEATSLRDILEESGISLEWHLYPGLHNDTYWSSHLEEYLLWYSAGWSDL